MTVPAWIFRTPRKKDRVQLSTFKCASAGESWDGEVEDYINNSAFAWATSAQAKHVDHRLLLLSERSSDALVGVVGHELADLTDGHTTFAATLLTVIAIATAWQGRRFSSGERVSDVLVSGAMQDISRRRPSRDRWVFAKVHEDNDKAIRLCRRFGLTHEMSQTDPPYRRLISAKRARSARSAARR